MPENICIRMPYLHAEKFAVADWDIPLYLWPGIAGEKYGRSYSPDYPLSPETARMELGLMRQLGHADLAVMRLAADRRAYAEQTSLEDELSALSDFAGTKKTRAPSLLEQAQRMLLWCWLAEERALEALAIEQTCKRRDFELLRDLQDPGEREPACPDPSPDAALLAPWKVCVANAAFFLPENVAIFAEGQMAEDMAECLDFPPGGAGTAPDFVLAAKAPLWRALGHTGPGASRPGKSGKIIQEIYNKQFLWLIRGRA